MAQGRNPSGGRRKPAKSQRNLLNPAATRLWERFVIQGRNLSAMRERVESLERCLHDACARIRVLEDGED